MCRWYNQINEMNISNKDMLTTAEALIYLFIEFHYILRVKLFIYLQLRVVLYSIQLFLISVRNKFKIARLIRH